MQSPDPNSNTAALPPPHSAAHQPQSQSQSQHPSWPGRKPRIPLSCLPCRSRKLKCNREQPCQNCAVRREPNTCLYTGPSSRGGAARARQLNVEGMQARINRLENLVTGLVEKGLRLEAPGGGGGVSEEEEEEEVIVLVGGPAAGRDENGRSPAAQGRENGEYGNMQCGVGVMEVNESCSQYRGATHWGDVLQELDALKSAWNQVQEDHDDFSRYLNVSESFDGPGLLCGPVNPVLFSELLSTIPPKPTADRLLLRFFDQLGPTVPALSILHQPTFMHEYEDHWTHPSETKLMWLGLLFSILNLTMLSYNQFDDELPEHEGVSASLAELYRIRTAQCLMMGDISKCAPYTLETLMFNIIAENCRKKDSETAVWLMVGVVVRAAMKMGYHRDSRHFPSISPFQGEMRRRVWCAIAQLDALSSFIVGLPCMIRRTDHDAAEPSNLYDHELSPSMAYLPPSRPLEKETPITYFIVKDRILHALGSIVDFINALPQELHLEPGSGTGNGQKTDDGWEKELKTHQTIFHLDALLAQAHALIPPHLLLPTPHFSLPHHPSAIQTTKRIQLEFMYLQGTCVLHRKFLALGRHDARFRLSRERCLESAIRLLEMQVFLWEEARARGSVRKPYWYRVSFLSGEFVLAAVVLCLEVRFLRAQVGGEGDGGGGGSGVFSGMDGMGEGNEMERLMLVRLKASCGIWRESRAESAEAGKVYRVLSRMLELLRESEEMGPFSNRESGYSYGSFAEVDGATYMNEVVSPLPVVDIDWSVWDSFVEGAGFEDTYQEMEMSV